MSQSKKERDRLYHKKRRQNLSEEDKEKERKRSKAYYDKNKEKILAQRQEKMTPELREYHREKGKEHYRLNKGKRIERSLVRVREIRIYFEEYKAQKGCGRCSEKHPACLTFHHKTREDKEAGISEMITQGFSIESILKEVKKCKVLCANCHMKLHWEERNKGL